MRINRLLLIFALALSATPSAADQAGQDRRYVSPSGAFSISKDFSPAGFVIGKESTSGTLTNVDFPFHNTGMALIWVRSVEWIKIDKPIDALQMDRQATDVVSGYLEARFGEGTLVIGDRGKSRDAAGRLVYAFAAKGKVDQFPAIWQGVVLFFDNGVALVSELIAQPSNSRFDPQNGVIDQPVVDWAETIQPGTQ